MVVGIGAARIRLEPENLDSLDRYRSRHRSLCATPYRAALPKEIFVAIYAEDDIAIIVDFIVDADGHIERISSGRQNVDNARRRMGAYPVLVLPATNFERSIFYGFVHHGHFVILIKAIELYSA